MERLDLYLMGIVLAHFAVVLVHSAAHVALGILPLPLDAAFILAVITVGPVAAILLFRIRRIAGAMALFLLMAASFAYGFVSHFLIPGSDNVGIVSSEAWTIRFVLTAALLGVLEIGAAVVALVTFRAARIPSAPAGPRG